MLSTAYFRSLQLPRFPLRRCHGYRSYTPFLHFHIQISAIWGRRGIGHFRMADLPTKTIDVTTLMSYSDDLVSILKNMKDINPLIHLLDGANKLRSSCEADRSDLHIQIQDYQKKINACEQNIDEAKNEIGTNIELELPQNELEEELQKERLLREELRIVMDEIDDLEHKRVSVEERKGNLKKIEKDASRQQNMLSMHASVTNISPDLGDQYRVSGHIVERDRKIVEKFEFESAKTNPVEICNSLRKIMDL
ncbi:kinetochore protein SPC24 homolog [Magnolia sinica]|uniref:kinetochore protein SPC24 homolog n=1 Tax=Magnolia sinica TaxID=86752 RepID=UPI002659954D|nr:kinetochore protein SPC24 homolog [Magnolia sinica]